MISGNLKVPYIFNKKIERAYFNSVICGKKRFEIRKDDNPDHPYQVGDMILLRAINDQGKETGEFQLVSITYVSDYAQKSGYKVLSIDLEQMSRY
ncbi:MAG: DUF3850 domain-containing protein [Lactobacillus sp.]|jgi:hypothetical protein|nr:DUF3850 domain-containing protein [Lactobacillus sp.]MCH4067972.1 DUF3850 domain-containing protein [Lactobacillus sp.]MCI1304072.1 DUF3850 domain-containing protein [Lactobacillus sp.]MCI1329902.1 DUF3850 domain-containing protein [Lactobacillus sp.]MCI1399502.1 DUF3850 domain-containing protein [Lactobacillus sp.]